MVTDLTPEEIAVLPEDALQAYVTWVDMQADFPCTCHIAPPCSTCTHGGHPDQLRETHFNGAD